MINNFSLDFTMLCCYIYRVGGGNPNCYCGTEEDSIEFWTSIFFFLVKDCYKFFIQSLTKITTINGKVHEEWHLFRHYFPFSYLLDMELS